MNIVLISTSQTCIVAIKAPGLIVLAADSRTKDQVFIDTNEVETTKDTVFSSCKIASVQNIYFAIAGRFNRDVFNLARSCISGNVSMDEIANQFEKRYYVNFSSDLEGMRRYYPLQYQLYNQTREILDIYFVGFEHGIPKVINVSFDTKKSNTPRGRILLDSIITRNIPLAQPYQYFCIGHKNAFFETTADDKSMVVRTYGIEECARRIVKRQTEITKDDTAEPIELIDIYPNKVNWVLNKLNCK